MRTVRWVGGRVRRPRHAGPAVEGLEARRLMATFNQFPIPIQAHGANQITPGPAGSNTLWFTYAENGNDSQFGPVAVNDLVEFNLTTQTFRAFPVPPVTITISVEAGVIQTTAPAVPSGIVAGPDGDIWFTELGPLRLGNGFGGSLSQIGRLDPTTGVISTFTTPTAGSAPIAIAVGPDGNLWFSETGTGGFGGVGKIGRITTAGAITEFPIGGKSPLPGGIASADGSLWFTDSGNNAIGKIDPTTGAVVEFPISTADANPTSITLGPGGALWFTESGSNRIGEIDPTTGAITDFALTGAVSPLGISPGPDGALWFAVTIPNVTDPAMPGSGYAEISPTNGAVTLYPASPTTAQPVDLTIGPDGKLWSTEVANNDLAQISPTPAVTLTSEFNPSVATQPAVFTATVAGPSGGVLPTGNVVFIIANTAVTVPIHVVDGQAEAVFTTAPLQGGTYPVTATYQGDAVYSVAEATPVFQDVFEVRSPSNLSIAAAVATGTVDTPNLFTIQVSGMILAARKATPAAADQTLPTGQVAVTLDGNPLVFVPLVGGIAQVETLGLTAGQHEIAVAYNGDVNFAPSFNEIMLTVVPAATTATLTATPNPVTGGHTTNLAATIQAGPIGTLPPAPIDPDDTPILGSVPAITGSVTFRFGSTVLGTVPLDANAGASLAATTDFALAALTSAANLPVGTDAITASYSGDTNYDPSMSTVLVTVNPSLTPIIVDGPRVTDVQRFGFHAAATTIVLSFDGPLGPASAEDVANYRIVGPNGGLIPVRSAVYDPLTNTVTLHPVGRLDVHRPYTLTVNGTTPTGVQDPEGRLLDGADTGSPGSNFVATIDATVLVVPGGGPNAAIARRLAAIALRREIAAEMTAFRLAVRAARASLHAHRRA